MQTHTAVAAKSSCVKNHEQMMLSLCTFSGHVQSQLVVHPICMRKNEKPCEIRVGWWLSTTNCCVHVCCTATGLYLRSAVSHSITRQYRICNKQSPISSVTVRSSVQNWCALVVTYTDCMPRLQCPNNTVIIRFLGIRFE